MQMRDDEILLVDSLHALYPDMMAGIPMEQQFRLYLEPLLQMKDADGQYVRWTDIRMMRRMLRDAAHRAYNPEKTLLHWHYVRASELRNIIPYINNTDYIINSAMPYELSIYRPKLLEEFNAWVLKYQDDPLREDAFQRAARIRKVLSAVEPLSDDRVVPDNSVLREFIGGSSYKY
jgi:uridine kinase